jgi:glycosyltransferase involved in cell wall biosynthesis
MTDGTIRLGYLTSHPIQYQAPLFRALANTPGISFEAFFCDMHGAAPSYDPGFEQVVKFDTPMLEGYRYRVLRNRAPRPGIRPMGLLNPEAVALARSGRFDAIVVHGYSYLTNLAVLGLPRSRRAMLLLRGESHGEERRPGWKLAVKRGAMPALLDRADHFLAVGALNRRYYESYGVDPHRITLAPYSVDNDFFSEGAGEAAARRSEVRRGLGLSDAGPVFLYCAKLTPVKRPRDLLVAYARHCKNRGAQLAFAGDGPLREELERLAGELGVLGQVRFLGFRNQRELPSIYAAADALILPSEREPWGLVVNEAMACGLAIAASDRVGCAPDLLTSANGFTFAFGDIEALGRGLTRWADRPEVLAEMGRQSRKRIETWSLRETVSGIVSGAERALARP